MLTITKMSKIKLIQLNDKNISIETERLKIYPIFMKKELFFDLYEIYSSSTNVENYCPRHTDFYSSASYIKHKMETFQEHFQTLIMYVIELKINSKVIGLRNIMLDVKVNDDGLAEFSEEDNVISEIIINENYWRNGYATEASRGIFSLLKKHGIKNILTFVPNDNRKSYQMDRNLGFMEYSLIDAINKFKYFPDCVRNTMNIENQKILIKEL